MKTGLHRTCGCVVAAVLLAGTYATANEASPGVTPAQAKKRLQEGSARFVAGKSTHMNADAGRRAETAKQGQKPFVTIVSCADSRVPPEILFDAGIGDVFVVRVAGNVCDTDEIGTVEYGTDHLGTPLLIILGHTKCGAVTAVATHAVVHGSIPKLVDNIVPAVAAAQKAHPDLHGDALVPEAIKANVWQGIEDVLKNSEIVRERVKSGKLQIEGALYDIASGKIEWMGTHPMEAKFLTLKGTTGGDAHGKVAAGHGSSAASEKAAAHAAPDAHGAASATAKHAQPAEHGSAAKPAAGHEPAAQTAHAASGSTGHAAAGHAPAKESAAPHGAPAGTVVAHAAPAEPAATPLAAPIAVPQAPAHVPAAAPAHAPVTAAPAAAPAAPPARTEAAPPPRRSPQLSGGLLERFAAEELYRQGSAFLASDQYAAAAERFRAAIQTDPTLLAAANDLAGVYYVQREYSKAQQVYRQVLSVNPNHEYALRGAALVHAALKEYPEARSMLERLLGEHRQDAQSWLDLGDVLFLMGDAPSALDRWSKAAQYGDSTIRERAQQRRNAYGPP